MAKDYLTIMIAIKIVLSFEYKGTENIEPKFIRMIDIKVTGIILYLKETFD